MVVKYPIITLATISLFASGCTNDSSNSTAVIQSAEEVRAQSIIETGVDLIPLEFFDWDLELSDLAGQVIVMNFWASWCIPCLESFPTMLDISSRYSSNDVRFITVNLDDYLDEYAYISALDFLSSSRAQIENYHLEQDLFEIYQFFGLENIPTIIVYNRSEDEQTRLGNEGDLLEPLLVDAINQALDLPLGE
jgi:thiol-disulfide isomerase/thioredoxin